MFQLSEKPTLYNCACSNVPFLEVNRSEQQKNMALTKGEVEKFHRDGYLLVENFLSQEECDQLRSSAFDIVDEADFSQHPVITFGTSKEQNHSKTDYFLTSGDKVRFFFEEGAIDHDGKLTLDPKVALNKIGHALHVLNPCVKQITFSDKVKNVAKSLEFKRPCIPQSMVIFKPPRIGGVVKPHQDSTFLYTSPMNLVGFWIALEDADLENGCMWFAPGTHKNGVVGRLKRTVKNGAMDTVYEGDTPGTNLDEFVAVPVRKGSLVLIHGEVVHKSGPNLSDRSRNIYTFHLYDADTSIWSESNWLQPTNSSPFPFLYE